MLGFNVDFFGVCMSLTSSWYRTVNGFPKAVAAPPRNATSSFSQRGAQHLAVPKKLLLTTDKVPFNRLEPKTFQGDVIKSAKQFIQGGSLPVISRVITPLIGGHITEQRPSYKFMRPFIGAP